MIILVEVTTIYAYDCLCGDDLCLCPMIVFVEVTTVYDLWLSLWTRLLSMVYDDICGSDHCLYPMVVLVEGPGVRRKLRHGRRSDCHYHPLGTAWKSSAGLQNLPQAQRRERMTSARRVPISQLECALTT
ncbi:hypothetical protein RRG08_065347 [Elysia crispata]|uniref:Uncharacterized protein n=1 Tax=Elysia crispata TaxID=231223 RepID=A0AAE1AHS0_9GAST|nr:hypothetical protein RRG08_065347 [Elysia crispata]